MIPEQFLEMANAYRLLSELDPRQLRKLLPLAGERQYEKGETIFREGDKSAYLSLIVSGEVILEKVVGGRVVPIQTLRPGEAMGWSALTADGHAQFLARALSPVATIAFPSERLREACDRDPEMGYHLMKQLLQVVTQRLDAVREQASPVRNKA
jgi:CRP/FNR family cyclic AMP-dependent transcriptional regulator